MDSVTKKIHYGQYVVPHHSEYVKLNVGQPSPKMLPLNTVKMCMLKVCDTVDDVDMLQYGDIKGYFEFRKDLAQFLQNNYKRNVNPEDLFITNGVTDGLKMLLSLLAKTGSTVYVEEPTYFLALNIVRDLKLNVESVKIQSDGIDVDELENKLKNTDPDEDVFLYTIPVFHNPTSYTMCKEKRKRLGELTLKYKNLTVIADEVYQLLYFDEDPPPPLIYNDCDRVVSLNSFSKIFAPSLRLGWIHTRCKSIMDKLVNCGEMDSSGGKSPLTQCIIHQSIKSEFLKNHILHCRDFLKRNCDALSKEVKTKLSNYVEFIKPTGGYFLWLRLNRCDSKMVEQLFNEFKISCTPGYKFTSTGNCDKYIRLSFSYYEKEGLSCGVNRLQQLLRHIDEKKLKLYVHGKNGKLGSLISQQKEDIRVCSFEEQAEIIVDVTSPEGTVELLDRLMKSKLFVPVVVGTTGHDSVQMDKIKEYSQYAPIAVISNFSPGVNSVFKILNELPSPLKDSKVSLIDSHHKDKKDRPSGTAKTMMKMIKKETGEEPACTCYTHGKTVGEHSIHFKKELESVYITHIAEDRTVFAKGAIDCCRLLLDKPKGLYDNSLMYQ